MAGFMLIESDFFVHQVCIRGYEILDFYENLASLVFLLPPFCDSPFCLIAEYVSEKISILAYFKQYVRPCS